MISISQDIESICHGEKTPDFKSEGERRIAYFLDTNLIKYQYEPSLMVRSSGNKLRIWYPDFYLPEFKTYIEHYGLVGNQNYNSGIKKKESVYSKMGLDVISVYPWMFNANWEKYIMEELKRTTIRRYKKLMAKTYWSKQKSAPYRYLDSNRHRYHLRLNKHY